MGQEYQIPMIQKKYGTTYNKKTRDYGLLLMICAFYKLCFFLGNAGSFLFVKRKTL